MDLAAYCRDRGWRRIAFIGITKHAGKTTALNAFVAQVQAHVASLGLDFADPGVQTAEPIGLLSIGLDGERLDTIMGIRKPPIFAPVGTLIASAERALEQSDAGLEYLEALPIESPLGTVLIARVTRAGHVLLAGVRQRQHVEQIVPRLRHHGAAWCLVDGAFDRVASAAPHLVDAAVLAIGATAGDSADAVAAFAAPFVQRFLLPETGQSLKHHLRDAHHHGHIGVLRDGGGTDGSRLVCLPRSAAVADVWTHPDWPPAARAIYLPGALTTPLLQGLATHFPTPATDAVAAASPGPHRGVEIVVAHPAQVLADRETLESWYRRGHTVSAWTPLRLAAIAINPHSVTGPDLPYDELITAVARIAPGVPLFDACSEPGVVSP